MDTPRNADGRTQLDRDNPWPGLESYDESSYRFFSGRVAESDDLQRRIGDEPLTVLFGKSGLGKTSLLKAGVFPRLREKGLLPIFLRLQFRHGAESLIEQVALVLFNDLRAQGIDYPAPHAGETLWEYLHRNGQEFWTPQNRLVRPVFVFDQFEEVFTLGRAVPAAIEAFREDLADLAENRIPAAVAHRIADGTASDLDLDVQAMPYKIVLSLREDFLADLEEWRLIMPSLRRNRMRLLPMGTEQALEAVCNARTNHVVAESLARKIVGFLSSGAAATDGDGSPDSAGLTVEPALLSLFCRGVNEHRKQEGKDRFDEALVEGGKGTIVTDFYRDSLKDQSGSVRQFIEEELVTEHGFRNSYSVDDALVRGFVTITALEMLVGRRLLRQEHHLGTDRVELTHDLLTKAVMEERDVRRRAARAEGERRQRHKLVGISAGLGATALLFLVLFVINWKQKSANYDLAEELSEKVTKLVSAESGLNKALEKAKDAADIAWRSEFKQWQATRAAWLEQEKAKDAARRAEQESQRANDERNRSRSRELAAIAETTRDKDPEIAVLLALEGLQRKDTAEARSALLEAAQYAWPTAVLGKDKLGGTPNAVALNRDGSRLAVVAGGRSVTLWDVTLRKPEMLWIAPKLLPEARSIAFSPDEKLLAVGRKSSVDLLNASTQDTVRSLAQLAKGDQQVVFDPGGRWLASIQQDDQILLWDYRAEGVTTSTVPPVNGVEQIAVLPGGKRVIAVSSNPLTAYALNELDGKWVETKLNISNCMRPYSVSPGPEYFSATWRARACTYQSKSEATATGLGYDEPTEDIIWSAAGGAFAQILLSQDIIVGTHDRSGTRLESKIKGVPIEKADDKARLISVGENGTRAAFIDEGNLVKIYSLGDYKPFLSKLDRLASVAPDGTWVAVARRTTAGKSAAVIDVIPIERTFASEYRFEVRKSIPVAQLPTRIDATQTSVVADFASNTVVFNAATGEPRYDPLTGRVKRLGITGELLLVEPSSRVQPSRLIKTKDGSELAQWQSSATGKRLEFIISASREALAVLSAQEANPNQRSASLYSVHGDRLRLKGQVTDLSDAGVSELAVADDAGSLTGIRLGQRDKPLLRVVWRVKNAREPAGANPASSLRGAVAVKTSPLGGYEIRVESEKNGSDNIFKVVRRADSFTLKLFKGVAQNSRFSSDDRWLVVWSGDTVQKQDRIQVFDLSEREIVLDLSPGNLDVGSVDFEGRNTILKVQFPGGTMLIPLDRALMERFAKWLAPPREWTLAERCMYGLDEDREACRKAVIAPRAENASPRKLAKDGLR